MQLSPSLWRLVCATSAGSGRGQGGQLANASILLAEDDGAVRSLLARVLRSRGYQVAEAGDGGAALSLARTAQFDLLITDVMMPGLSGPELVARLRAGGSTLPVVFITGYADVLLDVISTSIVLRKPFSPTAFVEAVERALASRP